jgi:hypothetical protein
MVFVMSRRKGNRPLSAALQDELRTFVDLVGLAKATERLGLSDQTVTRACAGFPLQAGNRLLIELVLPEAWKAEKVAE